MSSGFGHSTRTPPPLWEPAPDATTSPSRAQSPAQRTASERGTGGRIDNESGYKSVRRCHDEVMPLSGGGPAHPEIGRRTRPSFNFGRKKRARCLGKDAAEFITNMNARAGMRCDAMRRGAKANKRTELGLDDSVLQTGMESKGVASFASNTDGREHLNKIDPYTRVAQPAGCAEARSTAAEHTRDIMRTPKLTLWPGLTLLLTQPDGSPDHDAGGVVMRVERWSAMIVARGQGRARSHLVHF